MNPGGEVSSAPLAGRKHRGSHRLHGGGNCRTGAAVRLAAQNVNPCRLWQAQAAESAAQPCLKTYFTEGETLPPCSLAVPKTMFEAKGFALQLEFAYKRIFVIREFCIIRDLPYGLKCRKTSTRSVAGRRPAGRNFEDKHLRSVAEFRPPAGR